ncbi:hypothetical protein [Glaciecola sp. MH2013]|nr:hypothetical protein [Glaciecola sp. MH2013]
METLATYLFLSPVCVVLFAAAVNLFNQVFGDAELCGPQVETHK